MPSPAFGILGSTLNNLKSRAGQIIGSTLGGPIGDIAGRAIDTQRAAPPPHKPPTPGLIPTTPVKKITSTNTDGTSTTHEFHAPETTGTTGTPQPTAPTTPQVGTPMQNAQNVLNQSNLNTNPEYQRLALQNNLLTQAQMSASNAGLIGNANTVGQEGTNLLGENYANVFRPGQTTSALQGEKGILNPQLVNAISGNTAEAQRLLAGGQLATGGAENVLVASLPGQQGTSSQLYNPLAGAQGGGNVVTGANRQSAFDLTQQANQIQSVFNGADANFKLLVDTAKQGGVNDMNVPALNTLQNNLKRGLTSSAAVTNFLSTLATVRSQYASILGGGTATVDSQQRAATAIPDDISLGALVSLQQQMASEATNRVAGITKQVQDLQSGGTAGGTSGGSTGGNMFGSFFP